MLKILYDWCNVSVHARSDTTDRPSVDLLCNHARDSVCRISKSLEDITGVAIAAEVTSVRAFDAGSKNGGFLLAESINHGTGST